MKTVADAAGKREEIRGVDEVKNQMIYRRALKLAIPMMIQNGITNMVGLIDNVMAVSYTHLDVYKRQPTITGKTN